MTHLIWYWIFFPDYYFRRHFASVLHHSQTVFVFDWRGEFVMLISIKCLFYLHTVYFSWKYAWKKKPYAIVLGGLLESTLITYSLQPKSLLLRRFYRMSKKMYQFTTQFVFFSHCLSQLLKENINLVVVIVFAGLNAL